MYDQLRKKIIFLEKSMTSAPFPRQQMDVLQSATLLLSCHASMNLVVTLASLSLPCETVPRTFHGDFAVTFIGPTVGILLVSAVQSFVAFAL